MFGLRNGVVAEGDMAWVTGWSGKLQRLVWQPDSGLRILCLNRSASRVALEFAAPFGPRAYRVESAPRLEPHRWTPLPGATIRSTGEASYRAECPPDATPTRFYRVAVSP